MIEFNHVTKRYENGTDALKDVSIKIEKGEFVFVVGSSGAGKSTFLKLIMREEVPSAGTIVIDGITVNKLRKRNIPKLRRKLGIVFQDFRLIPSMTVFDNVAFAMRVIGTKEKKIRRRVPYVLSLMGLNEKARSYPKELSGGEQQRVALARALANNAEIIIADEPTGNVDPQMSYEIVDLLMRLNEAGTTVIMVTHEHSLVRAFDKRVIILDKGTVVSDGETLDRESATAHINAASEIANEHVALPEEDYSAYAPAVELQLDPNVGLDVPAAAPQEAGEETIDLEQAVVEAIDLEQAVAEAIDLEAAAEEEALDPAQAAAEAADLAQADAAAQEEEVFDLEQAVAQVLSDAPEAETAAALTETIDLPAEAIAPAEAPAAAAAEADAEAAEAAAETLPDAPAEEAADPAADFEAFFDLELVDLDAEAAPEETQELSAQEAPLTQEAPEAEEIGGETDE